MPDGDPSDPEERKIEKRRAKNRRTARVSRERKQAELSNLKMELAARTADVARLQQVIHMKDQQILKMAGMSSSNRGACLGVGAQSQRWGVSESAELDPCAVAKSLLTKRCSSLKTAPLPCSTSCMASSIERALLGSRERCKLSSTVLLHAHVALSVLGTDAAPPGSDTSDLTNSR